MFLLDGQGAAVILTLLETPGGLSRSALKWSVAEHQNKKKKINKEYKRNNETNNAQYGPLDQ